MAQFSFDETLDITEEVCPMTFVMAKVALEDMEDGQVLYIRMNGGRPVRNVSQSLIEAGHEILALSENADGTYDCFVRKREVAGGE